MRFVLNAIGVLVGGAVTAVALEGMDGVMDGAAGAAESIGVY